MKSLFWRLTMMFWILFVIVILSFGLTFYLSYEKSYSQKILEIGRNVHTIGETIDNNLNAYSRLVKTLGVQVTASLEENMELFGLLSDEELDVFVKKNDLNVDELTKDEIVFLVAYYETITSLDKELVQIKSFYKVDYRLKELKFIPDFNTEDELDDDSWKENHVILDEDLYTSYTDIDSLDPERLWTMYHHVELDGISLGYFQLVHRQMEINTIVSDTRFNKSIYYIADRQYIGRIELDDDSKNYLEHATFDEATEFLKSKGFHVSRYVSETGQTKILHYETKANLHRDVLRQTISLFEFSTILLIILFLFVSYLLFMAIIKPCYLLIDYVKRCGEGDYSIPSNLNPGWRSSFLMVRNAYLENERLLAVKDNQSQELEYAWKRALVANQAKTHFLAKVSHELKTPLNAIRGYVQLLKLTIEQPKQKKQLDIIDHSSELLLKLVNELLDFSMIEDGKVKLEIDRFDLSQTAYKLEEMFIINTNEKGIGFSIMADPAIPKNLYGDENRIKQIIMNLISNAIKFTEKGEITVKIELDYQNETDAYINVKVKDTGKGIASNKLESIFDAFTQENNTISRRFGGTGLGLSISKRLAEAMGGSLVVESKVGIGSTFTLFLPLSKRFIIEEDV